MERTKRYDFGKHTPHYAYGVLERALGEALGADQRARQGPVRGRLKRLSVLDLPSDGPGKGARRLYSWEESCQLLVALLMEDAGLDPVVVVRAIKAVWPVLGRKITAATSDQALAGEPVLLTLQMQTVAGPFRTGDPVSAVPLIGIMPHIDKRARAMYAKHRFRDTSDNVAKMFGSMLKRNEPGWFCVRNLTAAMSTMQTTLHGGV